MRLTQNQKFKKKKKKKKKKRKEKKNLNLVVWWCCLPRLPCGIHCFTISRLYSEFQFYDGSN